MITWLASYPKSGNTWVRIFLANYLNDSSEPADINRHLHNFPNAAARLMLERALGMDSTELHEDTGEIPWLRRLMYDSFADEMKPGQRLIYKLHDILKHATYPADLISPKAADAVIYIVRNPLDVCVSFARHMDCSLDKVIVYMAYSNYMISTHVRGSQLPQYLGTWSEHVRAWAYDAKLPTLVLRYEDMLADPVYAFRNVVDMAGLDFDEQRLASAVENSSFSKVQQQEREHGFRERPRDAKLFFRKGQVGGWRDVLSSDQVARVVEAHEEVMFDLGYLDASGEPCIGIRDGARSLQELSGGAHSRGPANVFTPTRSA